jgi:phosphatidate cytidylyltransferase
LVGKNLGRKKLFERISPKKTMEGFLGGVLFAIIAGFIISQYYVTLVPLWCWIIIAILVSVFGTLGDLIESKFKRVAGVKDSGAIMPGHGGIFDRLDSIIFVAPLVYLFLKIIEYVS